MLLPVVLLAFAATNFCGHAVSLNKKVSPEELQAGKEKLKPPPKPGFFYLRDISSDNYYKYERGAQQEGTGWYYDPKSEEFATLEDVGNVLKRVTNKPQTPFFVKMANAVDDGHKDPRDAATPWDPAGSQLIPSASAGTVENRKKPPQAGAVYVVVWQSESQMYLPIGGNNMADYRPFGVDHDTTFQEVADAWRAEVERLTGDAVPEGIVEWAFVYVRSDWREQVARSDSLAGEREKRNPVVAEKVWIHPEEAVMSWLNSFPELATRTAHWTLTAQQHVNAAAAAVDDGPAHAGAATLAAVAVLSTEVDEAKFRPGEGGLGVQRLEDIRYDLEQRGIAGAGPNDQVRKGADADRAPEYVVKLGNVLYRKLIAEREAERKRFLAKISGQEWKPVEGGGTGGPGGGSGKLWQVVNDPTVEPFTVTVVNGRKPDQDAVYVDGAKFVKNGEGKYVVKKISG